MIGLLGGQVGCSDKSRPSSTAAKANPSGSITIFMTTELKGSIEPCGCTSDPLGDLARTTELIESARRQQKHTFYMDGGSTLYTETALGERTRGQERLKSSLIAETFAQDLKPAAVGLGPYDLSMVRRASAKETDASAESKIPLPRMAINLQGAKEVELQAPRILPAGSAKVGVFGVVSQSAIPDDLGWTVVSPTDAAAGAVKSLKTEGADVIVATAHMDFSEARQLATQVEGIDFILVGRNAAEDVDDFSQAPKQVQNTWLIQPGSKGQMVSRLDLFRATAKGGFEDALGAKRAWVIKKQIDESMTTLKVKLDKWKSDPDADSAFLAAKRKELEELAQKKEALKQNALQIPASAPYFTLEQIQISKSLSCSPDLVQKKQKYDEESGKMNVKAAADIRPREPAKGEASYVGIEECSYCHQEAVDVWKQTKHAGAWETLTELGKEFDFECIGCHVTGWEKPGGSNLGFNEELRDVQCEVCHGPGSLHVEAQAKDKKTTIVLAPNEELCVACHSPEHSDTFDFSAYLRDVTGKGHGEAFRKSLGDGPTGGELRQAALKKAGLNIGENCPK